ncbi:MAG: bacteriohemerythrin [Candidatus Glassbacteria bacterium]|nr:bacteriohemerythrin [Candidatus Glassbacteria bacterium]
MSPWKPEYSVGVPGLDDQHKELFKLLDELSAAIENGDDSDLGNALSKMHVYILFHFSSEEHLLTKYGFDKLDQHIAKHADFKEKVQEFNARLSGDKRQLAVEIRDYLDGWISNHILETDKAYEQFLSARIKFKADPEQPS